jgi:hypothetical protein
MRNEAPAYGELDEIHVSEGSDQPSISGLDREDVSPAYRGSVCWHGGDKGVLALSMRLRWQSDRGRESSQDRQCEILRLLAGEIERSGR